DGLPDPFTRSRRLPERRDGGRRPGGARDPDRRGIEHARARALRVLAQGIVGAVGSEQGVADAPDAVARAEGDPLEPRDWGRAEDRSRAVDEPEHERFAPVNPRERAGRIGFGATLAVERPFLHVVGQRPAALAEVYGEPAVAQREAGEAGRRIEHDVGASNAREAPSLLVRAHAEQESVEQPVGAIALGDAARIEDADPLDA